MSVLKSQTPEAKSLGEVAVSTTTPGLEEVSQHLMTGLNMVAIPGTGTIVRNILTR